MHVDVDIRSRALLGGICEHYDETCLQDHELIVLNGSLSVEIVLNSGKQLLNANASQTIHYILPSGVGGGAGLIARMGEETADGGEANLLHLVSHGLLDWRCSRLPCSWFFVGPAFLGGEFQEHGVVHSVH
jgi:hypothetical protein